jgi:hypothetical protein
MKSKLLLLSMLLVSASTFAKIDKVKNTYRDFCEDPLAAIVASGSIQYNPNNAAVVTSPAAVAGLTGPTGTFSFNPAFTVTNGCNFTVTSACTTLRNATTAVGVVTTLTPGAFVIETITQYQIRFVSPSARQPVVTQTLSTDIPQPLTCPYQGPGISVPGVGYVLNTTLTVSNVTTTGFTLNLFTLIGGSSLPAALGVTAGLLQRIINQEFTAVRCCRRFTGVGCNN